MATTVDKYQACGVGSADRRRCGLAGRRRRGTTTVEFALVCPILFTLFLVCLEYGRAYQIKNAVAFSAYQGCRSVIIPGATASQAEDAAQAVLTAGMISSGTITVNPSVVTDSTETVTVTVTVPLASNMWLSPQFTQNVVITRACTLTREKTN